MWCLLVTGVAYARLFAPPAPNVDMNSGTWISADTASLPQQQPYVVVSDPQTVYALPQQLPAAQAAGSSFSVLGYALVAAGLGVVAGRQAVLFYGGKKSGEPVSRTAAGSRASNRGSPYYRPGYVRKQNATVQTQRNGFGNFIQSFQKSSDTSKYGVPIFLKNGNVNPAYLAAERKDLQAQSKRNTKAAEVKRKNLIKKGTFELAGYIKKAIGPVGSGKEYYQSGR